MPFFPAVLPVGTISRNTVLETTWKRDGSEVEVLGSEREFFPDVSPVSGSNLSRQGGAPRKSAGLKRNVEFHQLQQFCYKTSLRLSPSLQRKRLIRRLTLANPAALARNRHKQASLRCVGIMRLNRSHASQVGRGDVRGHPARGLREPKAVALQAKRIRLAG